MKRYEYTEGRSTEFWEIEQRANRVFVRWGRVGGKTKEQTTSCGSVAKATEVHDALVRDKTTRGYVLAGAGAKSKSAKSSRPAKKPELQVPSRLRSKLTPRPKQRVPQRKPFPSSLVKKLDAVREEVWGSEPALPGVRTLLALVERAPYGGEMGQREAVEIEVLDVLIEANQKQEAAKLWLRLVDEWSAASPLAGDVSWHHLARAQRLLGAKLPGKLRDRVRMAWAVGRLAGVYGWTQWPSAPKPPNDPATALVQAAAEIRLHEFDRARACLEIARRRYPDEAAILGIVALFEAGADDGARLAVTTLVAASKRANGYPHWESIAALLVYMDVEEPALVKQVLAGWKKYAAHRRAETSIFNS